MAAGFCPKNLAFVRKIMVLPESWGLQPAAPPALLARTPMLKIETILNRQSSTQAIWSSRGTAVGYVTSPAFPTCMRPTVKTWAA